MRSIFGLFEERDSHSTSTVLIGSSGVGKSVLFFLAALRKAAKKPVLFYRKTDVVQYASVFFMQKGGDGLDILFSGNIPSELIDDRGGLLHLNLAVRGMLRVNKDDVLVFVDGPKHDDRPNATSDFYNFFCTSGGHPSFKQAQVHHRWILDGWTRKEALEALRKQKGAASIKMAYFVCGGRHIITACNNENQARSNMTEWVDVALVANTRQIANMSPERKIDAIDRLFTMFRTKRCTSDSRMHPIQYIDSSFVLGRLTRHIDLQAYTKCYEFSRTIGDRTMEGLFYERSYIDGLPMQLVIQEALLCPLEVYKKSVFQKAQVAKACYNLTKWTCTGYPVLIIFPILTLLLCTIEHFMLSSTQSVTPISSPRRRLQCLSTLFVRTFQGVLFPRYWFALFRLNRLTHGRDLERIVIAISKW
jgi:hypothetical protein